VAVDRERHGENLPTPAGNQEDIRAPALVRGGSLDLPQMRPPVTTVHPRRQHQPVQLHHPANPLAVVAGMSRPSWRPEGSAVRPESRMLENKTRLLLILSQGLLDQARVIAGRATTASSCQ
jgi:hypothetical protein